MSERKSRVGPGEFSRREFLRFGTAALAGAALIGNLPGRAGAATGSYVQFDRHDTGAKFSTGKESGVVVAGSGAVRLVGGASSGSLTSRTFPLATPSDTFIASWDGATPAGSWVQTDLRVRSGGRWTGWFTWGPWASGTSVVRRHSVNGQSAGDWHLSTDTLQSVGQVFADAYQYRLRLYRNAGAPSPKIRALYVTSSDSYRHGEFLGVASDENLWGEDLSVPARSQMVYEGGEAWCSPTSLSMVMAYWAQKTNNAALDQSVPTVAGGTYDYTYGGNGNWPFNTAYAASQGLVASVNRFSSLGQVEQWIAKDIPVVASISWGQGQLDGAPIPQSTGHLLVIRGFNQTGEYVIVNDPAASSNSGVRRIYKRTQFTRCWLKQGSGGVAYLVRPKSWPIPSGAYAKGSW